MDIPTNELRTAIRQLDRAELYIVAARSIELGEALDGRLEELIGDLEDVREELNRVRRAG